MKALQVSFHGVKWMISCGRLDGLPGDVNGDQDPMPLQPLRGESILVIGPFPWEPRPHGAGLSDRPIRTR
jgi:hypothetical protein